MKTSMRMEWKFVSPALASQLLERNLNRKVKWPLVERIKRDIQEGNFLPTHQAVGIYEDGSFSDGQHRLIAIRDSGIGQWMWVCTGVPLASKLVIDSGIARIDYDQLVLAGIEVSRKMVDIAKCVRDIKVRQKLTRSELSEFCEKHDTALQFAAENLDTRIRGVRQVGVAAVVFRAYYTCEHTRLSEFCNTLITGQYERGDDEAARILRNMLMNSADNGGSRASREIVYWKTENSLMHFIRRIPITKLYAASCEQFPLPEETEPEANESEAAAA